MWQAKKKTPIFPNIPNGYSPRRRSPQTPRYHFLLPALTDLSVLSSDSLSGRIRSLLTAGPRSVLLAVSCFHTDCLQVISFLLRCFLSPTESSLQCVDDRQHTPALHSVHITKKHCPVLRIWMSNSWIVVIIVFFSHLSIPSVYIFFIISISNFYKIYSYRF